MYIGTDFAVTNKALGTIICLRFNMSYDPIPKIESKERTFGDRDRTFWIILGAKKFVVTTRVNSQDKCCKKAAKSSMYGLHKGAYRIYIKDKTELCQRKENSSISTLENKDDRAGHDSRSI